MKTALLLLMFCLVVVSGWPLPETNLRMEFERFKSQVEGQHGEVTLEMTQLKSDVKKLKLFHHQCPSGWTKFGDSCYYYVSTEEKTWQQSREYCQNKGADLVVINSGEEKDFVVGLVHRNKGVWIGLTDSDREGVWKWVDGTPLTTTTYWRPGEPNDAGGVEDCIAFYEGGYVDYPCGGTDYWVCEIVF